MNVMLNLDFDTVQNQTSNAPTPTGIAILTVCGAILVALIGGWVEVRKQRLSTQKVEHEVTPHREVEQHSSLREELLRVSNVVSQLDDKLDNHLERLVRLETKWDGQYNRRSTDR